MSFLLYSQHFNTAKCFPDRLDTLPHRHPAGLSECLLQQGRFPCPTLHKRIGASSPFPPSTFNSSQFCWLWIIMESMVFLTGRCIRENYISCTLYSFLVCTHVKKALLKAIFLELLKSLDAISLSLYRAGASLIFLVST